MQIADVMKSSLKWSLILAVVVGFVGATVGVIVAGGPGVAGAFWGAGMALVFTGLTTLSIRVGAHFSPPVFAGIVLGSWMVKMVLFIVLVIVLGHASGINGPVLFFSLVTVMLGTLVIDAITLVRSRVPYVNESVGDRTKDE